MSNYSREGRCNGTIIEAPVKNIDEVDASPFDLRERIGLNYW
jgi:hypothetical protein